MRLGGAVPCSANVRSRRHRDDRLSRRRRGHAFADRRHGARSDSVGRGNPCLGRPVPAGQPHPPACALPPVGVSGIGTFQDENMKKSASELISKRIAELGDWRGETLGRMRKLIKAADPDVVEEWKWMSTPIWSHEGIICTGESYKNVVKLTFAKGESLKDPARLFNSSLDGNWRRAIDIHEGEEVDASAFKALVRQAVALNSSGKSKPSKKAKA